MDFPLSSKGYFAVSPAHWGSEFSEKVLQNRLTVPFPAIAQSISLALRSQLSLPTYHEISVPSKWGNLSVLYACTSNDFWGLFLAILNPVPRYIYICSLQDLSRMVDEKGSI